MKRTVSKAARPASSSHPERDHQRGSRRAACRSTDSRPDGFGSRAGSRGARAISARAGRRRARSPRRRPRSAGRCARSPAASEPGGAGRGPATSPSTLTSSPSIHATVRPARPPIAQLHAAAARRQPGKAAVGAEILAERGGRQGDARLRNGRQQVGDEGVRVRPRPRRVLAGRGDRDRTRPPPAPGESAPPPPAPRWRRRGREPVRTSASPPPRLSIRAGEPQPTLS